MKRILAIIILALTLFFMAMPASAVDGDDANIEYWEDVLAEETEASEPTDTAEPEQVSEPAESLISDPLIETEFVNDSYYDVGVKTLD